MTLQTLRNFDLNLLVSLDALLSAGNVSHAAAKLHLSQSTVSGHLAKLRAVFRDELLLPRASGRGMVLTPYAEVLREQVREALAQVESLFGRRGGFDPATEQRTFTLAIVPSDAAALAFATAFIPHAKEGAGAGVRVALRTVDLESIVAEMERGAIDLLVSRQDLVPASLKSRHLVAEPFVMVQRSGHPRGNRPPSLAEFCRLGHVVTPGPNGMPSFVDRALSAIGQRRRIEVESSDFTLTMDIVTTTDYVATLPAHLVHHRGDRLESFDLPFKLPPLQLSASWHPRWQFDPGASWLRDQLAGAADNWARPAVTAVAA